MKSLYRILLLLLFLWGNLSAFGYLVNSKTLVSLGDISAASPLPLVFTGHDGVEDFANKYIVSIETVSGWQVRELTSEDLAGLKGPFNAISPYTTAVGFAPYLPQKTVRAILSFGLCKNGRVSRALQLSETVLNYELMVVEPPGESSSPAWSIHGACSE